MRYKLFLVIFTMLLSSCGGEKQFSQQSQHVPYIDELIYPASVELGEDIVIFAELSTDLNPALTSDNGGSLVLGVSSPSYFQGVMDGKYQHGQFLGFFISSELSNPTQQANRVEFRIPTIEIGQKFFYIPSVATAASGGTSFQTLGSSSPSVYPPESDLIEYREIVVNVLPAQ